ncbi:DUF7689 domain-containing protein [Pseudogemmatithrix spongiicola]|uniref:DUF7689 domain-containing protein n=1 Tax=Pseudogemmatithrix spongiicola TaxID=3062599 RepID=UPI003F5CDDDA
MPRSIIFREFPRLRTTLFSITSPDTQQYNCIAWAAGDDSRWWWPSGFGYWPPGVVREVSLRRFVEAFESLGYKQCPDGAHEDGVEKVVIYVDSVGIPTHAARQLRNGQWTSKLGGWEDVRHTVFGLTGTTYGEAAVYLSREFAAP